MEDYSSDSEISLDYSVEEGLTSLMIKSTFDEIPSTLFFQYNHKLHKLVKKDDRIYSIDWDGKKQKFCILLKAYKNVPDCILVPAKDNGLIRCKSFLKANLIWKLMKIEKMSILIKKLNKYQKFNHFPCTWQLGRKDNLWINFKKKKSRFPTDFNFIPDTYILPENYTALTNILKESQDTWIIKPVASSRGRGIRLMTSIESIPRRCLVQKYITNPHVINNKKYDLRLYIVITDFSPLKIYIYNEGLVRFASEEYDHQDENKHNIYMHLTNYSVNKKSQNFNIDESSYNGCKWSLTQLWAYFKDKGINFAPTWNKIKDIVIKTIFLIADETNKTVKKLTKQKGTMFELYGFDIILNNELNPTLLEVNLNPSLACESDLDLRVKTSLMADLFTLIGIVPYEHSKLRNNSPNMMEKNKVDYSNLNEVFGKLYEEYHDIEMEVSSEEDQNNDKLCEIIFKSLDEFTRIGNFDRLFPREENIDIYSKFYENPDEENILMWMMLKKKLYKLVKDINM